MVYRILVIIIKFVSVPSEKYRMDTYLKKEKCHKDSTFP